MDDVISPLYLIFKKDATMIAYMGWPAKDKLRHQNYKNLKNEEKNILEILETKEARMEPQLHHFFDKYNYYFPRKDYSNAQIMVEEMFDYIVKRYDFLKQEIRKK